MTTKLSAGMERWLSEFNLEANNVDCEGSSPETGDMMRQAAALIRAYEEEREAQAEWIKRMGFETVSLSATYRVNALKAEIEKDG